MRNPYKVLGIDKAASDAEVKHAFRQLAKALHPDHNTTDPKAKERFAEVNSAYSILGDRQKRAQFDRGEIDATGKSRKRASFGDFVNMHRRAAAREAHAGAGGAGAEDASAGGASFDDILGDILQGFGGRRTADDPRSGPRTYSANVRPKRGRDESVRARVTIENLVNDSRVRIELPSGRALDVDVPRGARDGEKIRLKNQGSEGDNGGARGDLIVELHIAHHRLFSPSGHDLRMDLPVALYEAVLGAKIQFNTPHGPVQLTLQPNTSGGRTMRLKNKGLPKKEGGYGDLLVTIRIALPHEENIDLIRLMRDMKAENPYETRGKIFG